MQDISMNDFESNKESKEKESTSTNNNANIPSQKPHTKSTNNNANIPSHNQLQSLTNLITDIDNKINQITDTDTDNKINLITDIDNKINQIHIKLVDDLKKLLGLQEVRIKDCFNSSLETNSLNKPKDNVFEISEKDIKKIIDGLSENNPSKPNKEILDNNLEANVFENKYISIIEDLTEKLKKKKETALENILAALTHDKQETSNKTLTDNLTELQTTEFQIEDNPPPIFDFSIEKEEIIESISKSTLEQKEEIIESISKSILEQKEEIINILSVKKNNQESILSSFNVLSIAIIFFVISWSSSKIALYGFFSATGFLYTLLLIITSGVIIASNYFISKKIATKNNK